MSMIWVFDGMKSKNDVCNGKDCMKNFCKSLKEHAMKIIKFEKQKMIPLTYEEFQWYEKIPYRKELLQKKIKIKKNMLVMKNTVELEIIVIKLVNTRLLHIAYVDLV